MNRKTWHKDIMAYHLSKSRNDSVVKTGRSRSVAMLMHVAYQKGFFHDRNVKMQIKEIPYARHSIDLLMQEEFNIAYLLEINIAYLGYLKPRIPIKCIASLEKRYSDSILMRHEEGITPKPADLYGKTIGFTPRTTSHGFLMNFLKAHGLPKHTVTLKPLSPQAMTTALVRGEVDAISIWHAYSQHAIVAMHELGLHWTHFQNNGIYESEVVLCVNKPFLIKQRKTCQNMILAMKDAENYIKDNPEILYPLICHDIGLSLEKLEKANPQERENLSRLFKFELNPLDQNFLEKINLLGEWITENDTEFIGYPAPDYTDLIDNSLFS